MLDGWRTGRRKKEKLFIHLYISEVIQYISKVHKFSLKSTRCFTSVSTYFTPFTSLSLSLTPLSFAFSGGFVQIHHSRSKITFSKFQLLIHIFDIKYLKPSGIICFNKQVFNFVFSAKFQMSQRILYKNNIKVK